MKDILEQMELTEKAVSPELRNQQLEDYAKFGQEAVAAGHTDMAEYYKERVDELNNGGERVSSSAERRDSETGQDMKAYYEAKKQQLIEERTAYYENKRQQLLNEKNRREQEWRMDKAVHGAPDYAGFGGWCESEYVYEAEKEYSKNGNSAEFRRLMEGAAKAHVREKYGAILK